MMDTFILALSTAVLLTVGYAVFWTVRTVHRVGPRRFARALGAFVWALLVASAKLFRPYRHISRPKRQDSDCGLIDGDDASTHDASEVHWLYFNYRTDQFDEGADPVGIYDRDPYNEAQS
ncbi:MAG: hypothetical protein ACREXX_09650 [Gammaproteobacteria bacterium]